MTPAARLAAAIEVLDAILAGARAETALGGWARGARYAGSGDRAAVRDYVFDALRRRRSLAALGGSETGRGLMLGALRAAGQDLAALFTGIGHAPPPLTPAEVAHLVAPPRMTEAEALDCPDWLMAPLRASLGDRFVPALQALQARAPVFLRVNVARIAVAGAAARLAAEGIVTRPVAMAQNALEVLENARGVSRSAVFAEGLVELQDAASQAVVEALPLAPGARVLDQCAGGGGKALAMAALGAEVFAHDAEPRRMADLPVRAARAGVTVRLLADPAEAAPFDLVLVDAPCSGSGSWRRDPEGKWRLTPARLAALTATQAEILAQVAPLVARRGVLAYATCSMLHEENAARIEEFLSGRTGWRVERQKVWRPCEGGDGFFLAALRRD